MDELGLFCSYLVGFVVDFCQQEDWDDCLVFCFFILLEMLFVDVGGDFRWESKQYKKGKLIRVYCFDSDDVKDVR